MNTLTETKKAALPSRSVSENKNGNLLEAGGSVATTVKMKTTNKATTPGTQVGHKYERRGYGIQTLCKDGAWWGRHDAFRTLEEAQAELKKLSQDTFSVGGIGVRFAHSEPEPMRRIVKMVAQIEVLEIKEGGAQ